MLVTTFFVSRGRGVYGSEADWRVTSENQLGRISELNAYGL
jgi:hypothetical protein